MQSIETKSSNNGDSKAFKDIGEDKGLHKWTESNINKGRQENMLNQLVIQKKKEGEIGKEVERTEDWIGGRKRERLERR